MKNLIKSYFDIVLIAILLMSSNTVIAQCNIITTIAGSGHPSYGGDGGPATAANIDYCYGVVVDRYGNVYFSDEANYCIRKVDTNGIISTIAGVAGFGGYSGDGGPATSAYLYWPKGLAIDTGGNIYVADCYNNCVRKISTSGIISTIAGMYYPGYGGDGGPATAALLDHPSSLTFDNMGNLFIVDQSTCVRRITPSGIISTIAGTGAVGYSGDGGYATAAQFGDISAVGIDSSGNVYLGDFTYNRVRKIETSGIVNTIAGTGTYSSSGDGGYATAATFRYPNGIHVDNSGGIYVSEMTGYRIRYINSSGIITTFAGTGSIGYNGDGIPATIATLYAPSVITSDHRGAILFADVTNFRIRKISIGHPLVLPISGSPYVNVGSTITLTDATPGGTWNCQNTSIATVGTSGVVTGLAPGIDTVCYKLAYDCDTVVVSHCITVLGSLSALNTTTTHPSITLYPNPTSNNVTLTATNLTGNTISIKCYSLIGALVLDKTATAANGDVNVTLDMSHLQSGIYEVVVRDEAGQRYVRSVVKE